MRSNTCPKCAGSMAEGYIMDRDSSSGHRVSQWIGGAPQKSWFGLKTGKRPKHNVQTWRCGRCGYLESYAKN